MKRNLLKGLFASAMFLGYGTVVSGQVVETYTQDNTLLKQKTELVLPTSITNGFELRSSVNNIKVQT